MKRPIIIGLTILAVTGLVGCSSPDNTKVKNNNSQNTEQESSNEQSSNKEQSSNNENSMEDENSYVGKVSDIIGNQVTIKLIDGDFELTDEMKNALGIVELSEEQMKQLDSGETIQLPNGGVMGSATANGNIGNSDKEEDDAAISIEDLEEEGIDVEEHIRSKNEALFNQIEFNGEGKDFTIPAGVPIHNGTTGKSGKLSDIKKGSVVDFVVDEKTNTVTRIEIRF